MNAATSTDRGYRVCKRCIMDTSTPSIVFDNNGVCGFCRQYEELCTEEQRDPIPREERWQRALTWIKDRGRGRPFDCILGVSGGVDSTYLAVIARDVGLRPLLVQFDNGWNSEPSVWNIRRAVQALDLKLETRVVDWEEFRDLQLSFLRASLVDLEAPSDHGITGTLLEAADAAGVKTILTGANRSTEGIVVPDYGYNRMDPWFLRDVHKRYGSLALKTFPVIGPLSHLRLQFVRDVTFLPLLDFLPAPYDKRLAEDTIARRVGWKPYGSKHHESTFTKFHQVCYLPKKCNMDKRRAHLSSLIHSGQLERSAALEELAKPVVTREEADALIAYVQKKLQLSVAEFEDIMHRPIQDSSAFNNGAKFFSRVDSLKRGIRQIMGISHKNRPF